MALKTLGMSIIQAETSNFMALFSHFLSRAKPNNNIVNLLLGYRMVGSPSKNKAILLLTYGGISEKKYSDFSACIQFI